jgi:hypothetical protein
MELLIYSTSPLRLDCILHSARGNGPFLDPVRIVVTPEIEVGTTFITVHLVQAKIDIIKLLIAVHAVIKHHRVITLATTSLIETVFIVLTTIPFADVFRRMPLTPVLDNFKSGQHYSI